MMNFIMKFLNWTKGMKTNKTVSALEVVNRALTNLGKPTIEHFFDRSSRYAQKMSDLARLSYHNIRKRVLIEHNLDPKKETLDELPDEVIKDIEKAFEILFDIH